jgi:DNA polymerase-1
MSDKLLLVDAFSQIYRAFHAIRSLTAPDGQPVNAIFGFTKMLRKLLVTHAPTHCAVVFDCGPPQRRLDVLPSYKEQRPPTPPNLKSQLPGIQDLLEALHIASLAIEGEEADDIIGTLAVEGAKAGQEVLIASQDKDFFQIISPRIRMLRAENVAGSVIDEAEVETRYGVRPEQMVDYLSLVGDSADNIPGAPGIGPKTAAELLRRYDTLEALLATISTLDKPKLREGLITSTDNLRRNQGLIRLYTNLRLPWNLASLRIQPRDEQRLRVLYAQWGFGTLLSELDTDSKELRLNL